MEIEGIVDHRLCQAMLMRLTPCNDWMFQSHVIMSCHYVMSLSHVIMSDSWVCNTVSIPLAGRLQAAPDSVHFVRILVGCRSSDLLPSWCHALDPPNHYCAAVHRTFECHRSQPTTTTTQSARLHDCCSVGPILRSNCPCISGIRSILRKWVPWELIYADFWRHALPQSPLPLFDARHSSLPGMYVRRKSRISPSITFSFMSGITHRNLSGEDLNECSMIFLFILSSMAIRPSVQVRLFPSHICNCKT